MISVQDKSFNKNQRIINRMLTKVISSILLNSKNICYSNNQNWFKLLLKNYKTEVYTTCSDSYNNTFGYLGLYS